MPSFLLFKTPDGGATSTEPVGIGKGLEANCDCKTVVQFVPRVLFAANHNLMARQYSKIVPMYVQWEMNFSGDVFAN